jgi:hypothetical protein
MVWIKFTAGYGISCDETPAAVRQSKLDIQQIWKERLGNEQGSYFRITAF